MPFFIIRFTKFSAHHDKGIRGITFDLATKVIALLKENGKVFITSERPIEGELEQFRLDINPLDIHHVMAFAQIFIGDSQTMAAEAGVLGTPFIRFNDFVGRINYLAELEDKYKLGYGINPDNPEKLLSAIKELLATTDLKAVFQERRKKMLSEKIDVAKFMTWLIENYPDSVSIMKNNPEFQSAFR